MQTSGTIRVPDAAASLLDPGFRGGSVAIRQDGVEITRSELNAQASRLADLLSIRGKGRVAMSSSRADFVAIAILACQLADCEILLLRNVPPRDSALWRAWEISGLIDENLTIEAIDGEDLSSQGFHILVATSGTTGEPKVARHSLQALLGRIRPRPTSREAARWLLTFHPASFAGLQVLLTALVSGDELIAISEPTLAGLAGAALESLPTHISATPTFWRSLLVAAGQKLNQVPLTQLTLGGEVADQSTLDRLRVVFPASGITHIYATTEAGSLFAVKDGRAGFPVEWLDDGVEGTRLRIVDGVLEVRSLNAMTGYLAAEGKSSFTTDGWLQTGDLVAIRDDRVHFLGRADTIISVGGAKVTPEEVEHVLLQVPDVLECRVFGIPNVITGSVVACEIVTEVQDHENLRRVITAYLVGRFEPYKVPRIIRFVQSIATSQSGKKRRLDGQA
jgi:acyl-coenzyme A synthetase/AMP-(fatty) acid ligase